MQTKTKVVAVAVLFAVLGFMLLPQAPLGNAIWPAAEEQHYGHPTGGEVGLLMTYGALSSVGFGIGFAFLLFGAPLVARLGANRALARAAHLAIFWLLSSWVPHDSLHQHVTTVKGLIALEFGFHLTLLVSGVILAAWFVSGARQAGSATVTDPDPRAAGARPAGER